MRRSFLILHRIGGQLPTKVHERGALRSEDVMWLLLDLMGARQGEMEGDDVGVLKDIDPVGPTRDLRFEW